MLFDCVFEKIEFYALSTYRPDVIVVTIVLDTIAISQLVCIRRESGEWSRVEAGDRSQNLVQEFTEF